jgi:hypothetical protein
MRTPAGIGYATTIAAVILAAADAFAQGFAAPQGTSQPPAGRGRSAYQDAARLPARILAFQAEPARIDPGGTVTLTWAAENPGSVTIEPALGRVAPRGQRKLSPAVTTTYVLTVTGVGGPLTRSVTVTVTGTTPAAPVAAPSVSKAIPRTADGKPDLSGVYGWVGAAPLPAASGSLPTTPTLKPGAEQFKVVRGPNDTGLYSDCKPPGIPQVFFVPYYIQIVQAPKHVVVAHEYLNQFRIIPTDGRPHPPDPDPSWLGNPTGHWEGDTLVVDSIGFNDKTEINGYRHTEALHVVERFTRNADALQYEATIEDPNVFAGPWMIRRSFPFLQEYDHIEEFVCENNRDYRGLFEKK